MSDNIKGLILWGVWISFGVIGGVAVGALLPFKTSSVRWWRDDILPKKYTREIAGKLMKHPYGDVVFEHIKKTSSPRIKNNLEAKAKLCEYVHIQLEEILYAAQCDKALTKAERKLARGFARGVAICLKKTKGHNDQAALSLIALSQFVLMSEYALPTAKNAAMLIEYELDNV